MEKAVSDVGRRGGGFLEFWKIERPPSFASSNQVSKSESHQKVIASSNYLQRLLSDDFRFCSPRSA